MLLLKPGLNSEKETCVSQIKMFQSFIYQFHGLCVFECLVRHLILLFFISIMVNIEIMNGVIDVSSKRV